MKIMDILVKDAVILDIEATEKPDVLSELAGRLCDAEEELDRGRLLQVLTDREALQSTGIGDGVAIPHGKMEGLSRLMASFARSPAGVDFDSIDGEKTHLFFLLVVPEHSGGQHLKALARISRFFRDASFRKALEEAKTADDVCQAIEALDTKL